MEKAELQLRRAQKALRDGRLQDAHAACMEALQRAPDSAPAFEMLGEIAWSQGRLGEAGQCFQRAHQIDPQWPRPLIGMAKILARAHRMGPAREAAERAAALDPKDHESLYLIGLVFGHAGDNQRAVALFERAAALAPRNAEYQFNIGYGRQVEGDLNAAERALRRCIEIDPSFERAYFLLVEMGKQTPDRNFIPVLERLFARPPRDVNSSLALGHALAKSYEDIGDPIAAMDRLAKAKAIRRRHIRYDHGLDQALFAEAAKTAPGPAIVGTPVQSDAPIFVVGMPRSGTTLTDRVLSSHPEVGSVGEMQTFAILVHKMAGIALPRDLKPEAFSRAASADAGALGGGYLKETAPLAGGHRRFVDKLPFNFLFAGLIHRALPNARIVCLRRDPIDVCLSNYRMFFGQESAFHDHAYDLCDIARYYLLFDRLIAHWAEVLPPDRFMSLSYESLVDNQEAETRRLLAFCGLTWDDRCLAFHENGAGVMTPSAHQVRQPLFKTSIGRWRRYGEVLAPMIEILRAGGVVGPEQG